MTLLRIATDVGGTFTDLVAQEVDGDGRLVRIHTAKSDTTPPHFDQGVLDVVACAGLAVADAGFFVHGTTVVINAITERKGAKTGLITTAGFRDVLEIARGNCPDYFNIRFEKPAPFIRRKHRRVVTERIDYLGNVVVPLDLSELPGIVADLEADGVEAVAICLINGYTNPTHERAVLDEVRRLWPGVAAVASHQITREWREYERTSTTALCAYVQPVAQNYLDALGERLAAQGMEAGLHVMQSNGGIDSVEATAVRPITIVESGPASGMFAAAALGRLIGQPNVIALDIGGTTAKCALIENGEVPITTEYEIERTRRFPGYPIMTPTIDIVEIGNGGGSIAWVDAYGALHVGPKSAGANPGPVAYGRGGLNPTTTDANLLTGRIDAAAFCGGTVTPDMAAVGAVFEALGKSLDIPGIAAARGVLRVANHNMINALKLVSVNRGHDPRDFVMVAFGGGGGMHATLLARELRIPVVIVPAAAAVFSAWGMLMADLRRDYVVTRPFVVTADALPGLKAEIVHLETTAHDEYAGARGAVDRVEFEYFVDARYLGQDNTVRMPLGMDILGRGAVAAFEDQFRDLFERKYSYRMEVPVEVVNLHVTAFGRTRQVEWAHETSSAQPASSAVIGHRSVDYDTIGVHDATIYDRDLLGPGMTFTGPAIIQENGTTTVVAPGDAVSIDGYRNIRIQIATE